MDEKQLTRIRERWLAASQDYPGNVNKRREAEFMLYANCHRYIALLLDDNKKQDLLLIDKAEEITQLKQSNEKKDKRIEVLLKQIASLEERAAATEAITCTTGPKYIAPAQTSADLPKIFDGDAEEMIVDRIVKESKSRPSMRAALRDPASQLQSPAGGPPPIPKKAMSHLFPPSSTPEEIGEDDIVSDEHASVTALLELALEQSRKRDEEEELKDAFSTAEP